MDRKPVKAKSYANIAIIKYWERRCQTDGPFDQFDFVDQRICIQRPVYLPYQQMRLRMNFYIDGEFQKIQLSKPKLSCDWWLEASRWSRICSGGYQQQHANRSRFVL